MQVVIGLNMCRLWGSLCIIELLRKVVRGCHWLVWPLVPVSSLLAWVLPVLSYRSVPKQKRQRSCWYGEMWLPQTDLDSTLCRSEWISCTSLMSGPAIPRRRSPRGGNMATWQRAQICTCNHCNLHWPASCSKPRPLPEIHMFLGVPLSGS